MYIDAYTFEISKNRREKGFCFSLITRNGAIFETRTISERQLTRLIPKALNLIQNCVFNHILWF